MIIRKAISTDLPDLVEIYNQAIIAGQTAHTIPVTTKSRKKWFDSHAAEPYPLMVAEGSQGIMGYLSLSPYRAGRHALRHTAEVSFYIHESYQRKGVASSLLKDIIEKSLIFDVKTLFAILLENNQGSILLLERYGFEKWGTMPGVADFEGLEVGHLYYGLRIRE